MADSKSVLASMTFANNILLVKVVLTLAVNLGWGLPPLPAQPGITFFYLQYAAVLLYMEDLARTTTVV